MEPARPREGRLRSSATHRPLRRVSIHAPTRGATASYRFVHISGVVSIHAPTRGATIATNSGMDSDRFRSTPPREGRRRAVHPAGTTERVSIHAPTRGATASRTRRPSADSVSIHAPTRGATLSGRNKIMEAQVSIHAPTRGATWTVPGAGVHLHHRFDPRPHARGDLPLRSWYSLVKSFDPRPHARGDPPLQPEQSTIQCFDPRPHARGDCAPSRSAASALEIVSIHAPTRGATRQHVPRSSGQRVSIHAPTRGATVSVSPLESSVIVSIHAPTRGATS